ncbi:MAG TPA: S9 family peptidase [Symbiobacteriaceae bacterium]|nr:S9 family peptidase [Symbiobacteriaceae bacterium]
MSLLQPVTPKDLFRFHPVSDPQISPDGSLIAYVVQTIDLEQNKSRSALWVVPARGGEPRRLTNPAEGSDRAPRWAPDGESLAFLSDRKGKPQLWVIPIHGGEARCVETKQRPVGEPVWSPDGRQIAFTANVFAKAEDWTPYPGAPAGDRQRAVEAANHEPGPNGKPEGKEPSGVKVITRLKFRMDGVGYYGDKRNHIFVVPADGSAPARQITTGDFDHVQPCWTADGAAVICSALRREDADLFNRTDLWRFDVTTGEATLLCESTGPSWSAQVAPDGRHLIFAGHRSEHQGSTTGQLFLLPLEGSAGHPVNLTMALDRPIGPAGTSDVRSAPFFAHRWAPDSRGVYFLLGDRGDSELWYAPVDGGAPAQVTRGSERTITDFSIAADGTIALLIGDGATPDEVFVLVGGEERCLTGHNAVTQELAVVRPERFTYQGAEGWPVDGWVIKPVGYEPGRRYPTVLSVHGGPHSAYGSSLMILFQVLASAGFAVVYTNPRGSQCYGQEFALAVVQDWGGKDFEDIMAGVDAVVDSGLADPDRLGVMGWSYGGFMTCWTVTHTDRFKAAITGAPVADNHSMIGTSDIPWFSEWHLGGNPWTREGEERLLAHSSIRYADRVTTPTMVVGGEGDLRCPISQAEEFYIALKRLGKVPAVHVRYPGEFHGIAKPKHRLDRYERTVAWFKYYLMGM